MSNANEKYMPALTGVRAIAAYLVFFHHYVMPGGWLQGVVREGHIGVSLFFVLSGFLICYRYYDKFSWNRDFIRTYVVNRIARIYPLYFILTTLTFAYFYFYKHQGTALYNAAMYVLNISFLRGFFEDFKFTGVAQGWSLTVEECFYFSALLIFPFVKAKRALIPLLIIFSISFSYLVFGKIGVYGFMKHFPFTMSFTFFGRCFEFFAGMFLALYLRRVGAGQLSRRIPVATIVGGASIVLMMVFLTAIKGDKLLGIYTLPGIISNNWLLPVGVVVFFYGLIKERSWLGTMLGSKLFDVLGKSSYAFYLVHIGMFGNFLTSYISGNMWFLFVTLNVFSIFLYYAIEHPLNDAIRRALHKRKPQPDAVVEPVAVPVAQNV